jgi:hypothetical protein
MSTAVRTPLWRSSQNFKKAKFAFLGFSEAQLPTLPTPPALRLCALWLVCHSGVGQLNLIAAS